MIRRLFRLIFGLVLTVVITVGGLVAFVYFSIRDTTNNIPYELYHEDILIENEVDNVLFSSLDKFSSSTELNVSVTEDIINKLIFAVIRQENPNYLPSDSCNNLSCRVIAGQEIDLPVVGRKDVAIKGAYVEFEDEDIKFYVILDLAGVPSTMNLTIKFEELDSQYKLTVNRLSLGKLNILSGFGKMLLKPIMNTVGLSQAKVNKFLDDKGIPLVYDENEISFTFQKEDIGTVLNQLVTKEGETPSEENELLMSLIDILAGNDLIKMGFFTSEEEEHFGIRLDLEKLTIDESRRTLPQKVTTPFNTDVFINNKTQSFIFTNLSNNPKLTFTDLDFNRIIYDKTNQYQDFNFEFDLPNEQKFIISIDGILINFSSEEVEINIILNINNLITIMKIKGEVLDNNTDNVKIKLSEVITLGEDQDEVVSEFITTNNLYLLNLIGDNLGQLDIINYNKDEYTFILGSESFNQLINVGGNNDNPLLTVDKIRILSGQIDISISYQDQQLLDIINNVTDLVNDFLENNTISVDDFDTTDPEQSEVVEDLLDALDNISTSLSNDDELTPEQADELIDLINQLDDDNLDIFTNLLEQEIDDEQLSELYDLMFGN